MSSNLTRSTKTKPNKTQTYENACRVHIAEEVARSPFGVQTRYELDSSRRLLMSWPGSRATFPRLHLIFVSCTTR